MVLGDEQNAKSRMRISVLSMGIKISPDSCLLNKDLRDQDSSNLIPTEKQVFPSPESIHLFEKWLHRTSSGSLDVKDQPDIHSLAFVHSSWEIYLRFNTVVLTVESFILQIVFKHLGTMRNNSPSTPTPLLSDIFEPNLSLVLPHCVPKLSGLLGVGIKNLQIGKGGFPAHQPHHGAVSSCTRMA